MFSEVTRETVQGKERPLQIYASGYPRPLRSVGESSLHSHSGGPVDCGVARALRRVSAVSV